MSSLNFEHEQIWKKFFLLETHTHVKKLITSEGVHFLVLIFLYIVIIIIIGLIQANYPYV